MQEQLTPTPSPAPSLRPPVLTSTPTLNPLEDLQQNLFHHAQQNPQQKPLQASLPFFDRWACHGSKPTDEYLLAKGGNVPLCLRVTPGNDTKEQHPSRSLCLLGSESLDKPPVYCYQDDNTPEPSFYLWWSRTAWRLSQTRDDDHSWYILPSAQEPLPSELPSNKESGWLGWDGDVSEWQDTTMTITPCQDPVAECTVTDEHQYVYSPFKDDYIGPSNATYTYRLNRAGKLGGFGMLVLVGMLALVGFAFIFVFTGKCSRGRTCRGTSQSTGKHHHSDAGGGVDKGAIGEEETEEEETDVGEVEVNIL